MGPRLSPKFTKAGQASAASRPGLRQEPRFAACVSEIRFLNWRNVIHLPALGTGRGPSTPRPCSS